MGQVVTFTAFVWWLRVGWFFFVYILVGQVVYHDSFILWRLRLLSQINRRM